MRAFFVLTAVLLFLVQPAMAACSITPMHAVSKVPYFGSRMLPKAEEEGSVAFTHIDDPRMIVNFTMAAADPAGNVSRSQHVERLDEYARYLVGKAEQEDRWAEHSVFPYDPVAWRVVESSTIDGIGDAIVGHMEIRLTPQCILVADFVSPSSQNLRSRWITMAQEVANIRTGASDLVVPDAWAPDDTAPTGIKAIAGGFLSPLVVMAIIYLLLGHLRRLDPPGLPTRAVLGCCAFVSIGMIVYQHPFYMEALAVPLLQAKYVDNMLLLGFAASAAVAGMLLAQQAALVGLIASCISGFAIAVASALGWTPDSYASLAVGSSLILMGSLGFYAWSRVSGKT